MATNGETEATAMAEVTEVKAEPEPEPEPEPMDVTERTADYQKLIDYGIDATVSGELDNIYKTGKQTIIKFNCNKTLQRI